MRCGETRIATRSRPRPDFKIERPTTLPGSAKIGDTGCDLAVQAVEQHARGVGLALSTTLIGLCIAIPALLASNWLSRRLEVLSSRLDVLVEALEARRR